MAVLSSSTGTASDYTASPAPAGELEPTAAAGANAARCEVCGAPVRVQMLKGYRGGQPLVGRYCLHCADGRLHESEPEGQPTRTRLSPVIILTLAAVVFALLGGLGDLVGLRAHAGFGPYQQAALGLGVVMVLVGALLRVDLVALGGLFVLGGTLCADWLGWTRTPGVGWKQETLLGIAAGFLLAALGVYLARRWRARHEVNRNGRVNGPLVEGG